MTTDTSVKLFKYVMSGAPDLDGAAANLIDVLDACLVNGFGSVTLDSLVVASNVATATYASGHNFAMDGDVGPVIKIEGATPAGLNGEFRIQSVPSASTFTFTTSGISDQTATGTITAKRAPAGFEKAFSGTNKAAYRSLNSLVGTQLYFWLDETSNNRYPEVRMYEAMTDIDTGTGVSTVSDLIYCIKSSSTTPGAYRDWRIYADSLCFYFFVDGSGNSEWDGGLFFGDFISYTVADAYNCKLVGAYNINSVNYGCMHRVLYPEASVIARDYSQIGNAIRGIRLSHIINGSYFGYNTGAPYPNPGDNALHFAPIEIMESSSRVIRGIMPGLYNPLNTSNDLDDDVNHNVASISRVLKTQRINNDSRFLLDISGPWR